MFQLPSNRATRLGLNILILLAGGIALRLCQSVFVPLVIALLLACALAPVAVGLHRHLKIRWPLACITAVFGVIVFTVLISLVLFASVTGLVGELEPGKLSDTIDRLLKKVNDVSPFAVPTCAAEAKAGKDEPKGAPGEGNDGPAPAADVMPPVVAAAPVVERPRFGPTEEQIKQFARDKTPALLEHAGRLGMEWLFLWFFILFLLFFLLLEGPTLARRLVDIFGPSAELKSKANEVLIETAQQIRTYIVWRTIVNFGLALIMGTLYQWGGLRQPWTWAILLAILNYIPYLGPFLAGFPALLDAFVYTDSFGMLTLLFVLYWAVIILEGYLVVPLVMGRSMDLNATTVMLACLFWELVWGMTGLFLAMPIMAGVKSVCVHVPGWWQWANLMSAEEVAAPPEPGGPVAPPFETSAPDSVHRPPDGSPKAGAAESRAQKV